ncbi:hypothetical protein EVAR_63278_1 [Eumeta japonica]|uniref:Uncharacterized protein n=1 Tax=Eumeta variegata TaxID=151549 RepID=A0A4C1YWP1_EUMVA|nr:hypothetical protein EVAR_63278_1 [Eumeta japonica]
MERSARIALENSTQPIKFNNSLGPGRAHQAVGHGHSHRINDDEIQSLAIITKGVYLNKACPAWPKGTQVPGPGVLEPISVPLITTSREAIDFCPILPAPKLQYPSDLLFFFLLVFPTLSKNRKIKFKFKFKISLFHRSVLLSPGIFPGVSGKRRKIPYRGISSFRLDYCDEVRHSSRLVLRRGETRTKKVRFRILNVYGDVDDKIDHVCGLVKGDSNR